MYGNTLEYKAPGTKHKAAKAALCLGQPLSPALFVHSIAARTPFHLNTRILYNDDSHRTLMPQDMYVFSKTFFLPKKTGTHEGTSGGGSHWATWKCVEFWGGEAKWVQ